MMATKTVKVCDGCGTDEREPTVALAEAAKNPRQGEMINQWHGADLCLSCLLIAQRVTKRVDDGDDFLLMRGKYATVTGLTGHQKQEVRQIVNDMILRIIS